MTTGEKKQITSDDLMPNGRLNNEPEMEAVRNAAFNAVVGLIGKGYPRSEVMEAIMGESHTSAITSILRLRVELNKGVVAPWEKKLK